MLTKHNNVHRALLNSPRILLLDESCGSLDDRLADETFSSILDLFNGAYMCVIDCMKIYLEWIILGVD